jgi:hypothetical protein
MSLSEILINNEKLTKYYNFFELEDYVDNKIRYSKKIAEIESQNIELNKLIESQDSAHFDEKIYVIDLIGHIQYLEKIIENETKQGVKDSFLENIIENKKILEFIRKKYFTENQISVLSSLNKNDVLIKKYSLSKDYLIRLKKIVEDEDYWRAKNSRVDFEGYEVLMSPYKILYEYFILNSDGSLNNFSEDSNTKKLKNNFLNLTYLF